MGGGWYRSEFELASFFGANFSKKCNSLGFLIFFRIKFASKIHLFVKKIFARAGARAIFLKVRLDFQIIWKMLNIKKTKLNTEMIFFWRARDIFESPIGLPNYMGNA